MNEMFATVINRSVFNSLKYGAIQIKVTFYN